MSDLIIYPRISSFLCMIIFLFYHILPRIPVMDIGKGRHLPNQAKGVGITPAPKEAAYDVRVTKHGRKRRLYCPCLLCCVYWRVCAIGIAPGLVQSVRCVAIPDL